jgi:hypothetical protein
MLAVGNPALVTDYLQSAGRAAKIRSSSVDVNGSYSLGTQSFDDAKAGSFFFWVKRDDVQSEDGIIVGNGSLATTNRFGFNLMSDGTIYVRGANTSNTLIFLMQSQEALEIGVWTAVMASWGLATTQGEMWFQQRGGTSYQVAAASTATDDTIDYSGTGTELDCYGANASANRIYNASFSQVWFSDASDAAFGTAANRLKFATVDGKPKNFGSDGASSTGVTPSLYWFDGHPSTVGADVSAMTYPQGGARRAVSVGGPY